MSKRKNKQLNSTKLIILKIIRTSTISLSLDVLLEVNLIFLNIYLEIIAILNKLTITDLYFKKVGINSTVKEIETFNSNFKKN